MRELRRQGGAALSEALSRFAKAAPDIQVCEPVCGGSVACSMSGSRCSKAWGDASTKFGDIARDNGQADAQA